MFRIVPEMEKLFTKYQLSGRGGADRKKRRRMKTCLEGSKNILIRRKSTVKIQGHGRARHVRITDSSSEQPKHMGFGAGGRFWAKGGGTFWVPTGLCH